MSNAEKKKRYIPRIISNFWFTGMDNWATGRDTTASGVAKTPNLDESSTDSDVEITEFSFTEFSNLLFPSQNP